MIATEHYYHNNAAEHYYHNNDTEHYYHINGTEHYYHNNATKHYYHNNATISLKLRESAILLNDENVIPLNKKQTTLFVNHSFCSDLLSLFLITKVALLISI